MGTTDESPAVLVVDDEKNLRESLAEYLSLDGFSCTVCGDGAAALEILSTEAFDAVVLDLRLPGMDGLAILSAIHGEGPRLPVIMMSAHGEIHDAVSAMKLGAVDYLVKPFDPAELVLRLNKAIAAASFEKMANLGKRLAERDEAFRESGSPVMKKVYDLVTRVAPTNSTVLITGESGTGKEVVARDIHRLSNRAQGPFVPVNVGAIPESLLESELFGHEKGAFTGAESRRQGLFELASGGTLFLDELGEMPASMQVKLLRVLQDRTIQRLGGNRPIPVDVRILAATNKNLEEAVRDRTFREDLYFRIHVIAIELPPLRERREDIAPLAGFFLSRFARETGKAVEGLSSGAIELLQSWPFPGNIRELENSIERAVILSNGPLLEQEDFPFSGTLIRAVDRPPTRQESPTAGTVERLPIREESPTAEVPQSPGSTNESGPRESGTTIRDAEKELIRQALERNAGHREKTAGELGITRRTLLNKMREYRL